jgi:hypothetical protein
LADPGVSGGGGSKDAHWLLHGLKYRCDGDAFDARYEWSFMRIHSWVQRDSVGDHAPYNYGAEHPEVFNVALGDGSVRSLGFRIDGTLMYYLAHGTDRNKLDWDLIR